MLTRHLVRLAQWVVRRWGPPPAAPILVVPDPPEVVPYLAEARRLTVLVDAAPQGGEWKRHQVYAALAKTYPTAPKRALGLAIEWALRKDV